MDFITGFPMTSRQHDSIMVVVDKLSMVSHFIVVKSTNSASKVAQIFTREIVILHGVPKTIISYRDVKFTSRFWKELFSGLGDRVRFQHNLSSAHSCTYIEGQ